MPITLESLKIFVQNNDPNSSIYMTGHGNNSQLKKVGTGFGSLFVHKPTGQENAAMREKVFSLLNDKGLQETTMAQIRAVLHVNAQGRATGALAQKKLTDRVVSQILNTYDAEVNFKEQFNGYKDKDSLQIIDNGIKQMLEENQSIAAMPQGTKVQWKEFILNNLKAKQIKGFADLHMGDPKVMDQVEQLKNLWDDSAVENGEVQNDDLMKLAEEPQQASIQLAQKKSEFLKNVNELQTLLRAHHGDQDNRVNQPVNQPVNRVNQPANPPAKRINPPVKRINPPVNQPVNQPVNHANPPAKRINPPANNVNPPANNVNQPANNVNQPAKLADKPANAGTARVKKNSVIKDMLEYCPRIRLAVRKSILQNENVRSALSSISDKEKQKKLYEGIFTYVIEKSKSEVVNAIQFPHTLEDFTKPVNKILENLGNGLKSIDDLPKEIDGFNLDNIKKIMKSHILNSIYRNSDALKIIVDTVAKEGTCDALVNLAYKENVTVKDFLTAFDQFDTKFKAMMEKLKTVLKDIDQGDYPNLMEDLMTYTLEKFRNMNNPLDVSKLKTCIETFLRQLSYIQNANYFSKPEALLNIDKGDSENCSKYLDFHYMQFMKNVLPPLLGEDRNAFLDWSNNLEPMVPTEDVCLDIAKHVNGFSYKKVADIGYVNKRAVQSIQNDMKKVLGIEETFRSGLVDRINSRSFADLWKTMETSNMTLVVNGQVQTSETAAQSLRDWCGDTDEKRKVYAAALKKMIQPNLEKDIIAMMNKNKEGFGPEIGDIANAHITVKLTKQGKGDMSIQFQADYHVQNLKTMEDGNLVQHPLDMSKGPNLVVKGDFEPSLTEDGDLNVYGTDNMILYQFYEHPSALTAEQLQKLSTLKSADGIPMIADDILMSKEIGDGTELAALMLNNTEQKVVEYLESHCITGSDVQKLELMGLKHSEIRQMEQETVPKKRLTKELVMKLLSSEKNVQEQALGELNDLVNSYKQNGLIQRNVVLTPKMLALTGLAGLDAKEAFELGQLVVTSADDAVIHNLANLTNPEKKAEALTAFSTMLTELRKAKGLEYLKKFQAFNTDENLLARLKASPEQQVITEQMEHLYRQDDKAEKALSLLVNYAKSGAGELERMPYYMARQNVARQLADKGYTAPEIQHLIRRMLLMDQPLEAAMTPIEDLKSFEANLQISIMRLISDKLDEMSFFSNEQMNAVSQLDPAVFKQIENTISSMVINHNPSWNRLNQLKDQSNLLLMNHVLNKAMIDNTISVLANQHGPELGTEPLNEKLEADLKAFIEKKMKEEANFLTSLEKAEEKVKTFIAAYQTDFAEAMRNVDETIAPDEDLMTEDQRGLSTIIKKELLFNLNLVRPGCTAVLVKHAKDLAAFRKRMNKDDVDVNELVDRYQAFYDFNRDMQEILQTQDNYREILVDLATQIQDYLF